jgi:hypothetical protein
MSLRYAQAIELLVVAALVAVLVYIGHRRGRPFVRFLYITREDDPFWFWALQALNFGVAVALGLKGLALLFGFANP